MRPKRQVYFVTGTDTGVGKTTVCAALLQRASQQGLDSLGLKPVASGCRTDAQGQLVSEDAEQLMAASSVRLDPAQVCPFRLREPWSPHLAAAHEGRRLQVSRIVGLIRGSLQAASRVLIEGAGGWRVPLNDRETLADVARQLQLPVLLVVGIRVGCLNHALLSAEAIRRDGLVLAGFYAVEAEAGVPQVAAQVDTLRHMLGAPCLGWLPHDPAAGVAQRAKQVRWPGEPA